MGKIRQLREDQLINGGSQEHIYPITYVRAVYSKDKINLQDILESIREGDSLKDDSIKTRHLNDGAVTTSKLDDGSVTTPKISDGNVTTGKIANESITTPKIGSKAVTVEKLAEDSVTTDKIKDESVTEDKLAESSVGTSKIKDSAVTNDKVANDSLTRDKLDPELRKTLDAAIGLPDELVTMIQDVDKNLNKLNDTVYPIVLGFTVNPNAGTMKTDVVYSVKSDNEYLVPDTLSIIKKVNDEVETVLTNYPTSNSRLVTPIQGAREIFKFAVTKEGRTSQSISQTKYLCYYGGNAESTITAEILNTLSRVSTTGVSFNSKVTTKDNDYIWLVVPSYLSITHVTSAGFDVTLAAPQTITNNLGSFKAYRTTNPLTSATWNLVIS